MSACLSPILRQTVCVRQTNGLFSGVGIQERTVHNRAGATIVAPATGRTAPHLGQPGDSAGFPKTDTPMRGKSGGQRTFGQRFNENEVSRSPASLPALPRH
jgi:hypothetical protein